MRSGDVQLDLFAGAKPLDAHVWRKEADGFYVEPEWCSERLFADCHGQTWRYIERNT